MANPFLAYVSSFASNVDGARSLESPAIGSTGKARPKKDAPLALLFSPHPDDEVITGLLPLRLMRESGWRVTNVAVTLGSNQARQAERRAELQACCERIGFDLILTGEKGLEHISSTGREKHPDNWNKARQNIAAILLEQKPALVCLPHARDWNGTHIGTHGLVSEALASLGTDFRCAVLETEFWGAMDSPNLMVEARVPDLADLIEALALHKGEVSRNPYHLNLPAWMMDNVRRGSELVGGQGGTAPEMRFATLYRLSNWSEGRLEPRERRLLPATESAGALFL